MTETKAKIYDIDEFSKMVEKETNCYYSLICADGSWFYKVSM